jgi:hypothetical protein
MINLWLRFRKWLIYKLSYDLCILKDYDVVVKLDNDQSCFRVFLVAQKTNFYKIGTLRELKKEGIAIEAEDRVYKNG